MKLLLSLLGMVLVIGSSTALAQIQKTEEEPVIQRPIDVDFKKMQQTNEQILPQRQFLEQALEKEIDPDAYELGPGDQLLVKVWGVLETQFIAEITPEGHLIIPSVAEIDVKDLTLRQGKNKIEKVLARYFKKSDFSVYLVKLRKFRVYVVGEVLNPGTYFLRGSDRLGDALELAGGVTTWGNDTQIEIRHLESTIDTVDITKFYSEGIKEANPFLRGGDLIYVPPIDLSRDYVIIEGNVGSQGIYQIKPQETLYTFLTRLRALKRNSNIEQVVIIRDGIPKYYNLLSDNNLASSELLQRGDRIIIPTIRNRVYVKGEVAQPGPYPYLAHYLARDYAGLAGLLESSKAVKNLYVIHAGSGRVEKGEDVIVEKGDIIVVPRRTRESVKDYLSILTPLISIGLSTFAIIRASR